MKSFGCHAESLNNIFFYHSCVDPLFLSTLHLVANNHIEEPYLPKYQNDHSAFETILENAWALNLKQGWFQIVHHLHRNTIQAYHRILNQHYILLRKIYECL